MRTRPATTMRTLTGWVVGATGVISWQTSDYPGSYVQCQRTGTGLYNLRFVPAFATAPTNIQGSNAGQKILGYDTISNGTVRFIFSATSSGAGTDTDFFFQVSGPMVVL
jgi:hypothetical protein